MKEYIKRALLFIALVGYMSCVAWLVAQAPASPAAVIHPTPTCGGWYSQQVGQNCVMTFRFTSIDGLTCVVNTNPSPQEGQSPVEVICTYPVTTPMLDKKAAK